MRKPTENSVFDYLETSPDNQRYIKWFEKLRWGDEVISPYDPTATVWELSDGWYKCSKTKKHFNVKTGTVLKYTKIPLRKWYLACCYFLSKKGVSAHQLGKSLRITTKTAWLLLKDIRSVLKQSNFIKDMLKNLVEIDETLVGGKNINKHWDKKVPNCQGRSCVDKTPILGMLGDYLVTVVTSDTKLTTLESIINKHVEEGSKVYTDDWYRHSNLSKRYNHQMVNHSAKPKQYKNGEVTTNSIEGVWSPHFKVTIKGTYHNNISDKYLQNYADEFTFRYNTRNYSEIERIELLFRTLLGNSLTYQEFNQL